MVTTIRVHMNPKESLGNLSHNISKSFRAREKHVDGQSDESQGQRILYELVYSAGNCEKQRDGSGRIMYTDDGHEIHPYRLPYEVHRAACRELADRFEEFYPHFKIAAACWHGDEFYLNEKGVKEHGTEHVHINFIPWANGYKRGLPVQASMSKALEQMGFVNSMDENGVWHNAYYYWTQDVQKKFEGILREKFAEHQRERAKELEQCSLLAAMFRPEPLYFEHPAKGKNLPNLAPAEYRELKDVERWMKKRKMEKDGMRISIYDACMEELSPVLKRKAKAQYDAADALSIEVRRQMEIAEASMKDDDKEDDTGYSFVV